MNDSLIKKIIDQMRMKVEPELSDIFEREVVEQVDLLRRTLSQNLLDSFAANPRLTIS